MSRPNVAKNATGQVKPKTGAGAAGRSVAATGAIASTAARPTTYAYGWGSKARHYTANGYGHGYRNRASSRGYGRSQSNARVLVSRLRSVHQSLARLDHDYRGHRVNAMHALSSAIRSLSHRSTSLVSNTNRLNGGNGRARNVANNNNGAAARNRIPQAQSDARMAQALRTTQGIHMQMTNSATNSYSTARTVAHRHVSRAVHELQTALAMR